MAHLLILRRDRPPEVHPLDDVVRIGRGDGQDITLVDPKVSSAHARVAVEDGETYVEDLGSKNGSFLNGDRLESADRVRLRSGDEIAVGTTLLRYVVEPDPVPPRLHEDVTDFFSSDVRTMVEGLLEETASRSRAADGSELDRQLSVLYRLLKLGRPQDGLEPFLEGLAELARECVLGTRAEIWIANEPDGPLSCRASAGESDGPAGEPPVASTVLTECHRSQRARLEPRPGSDGGPLTEVLLAPVPGDGEQAGGVIHVERAARGISAATADLRLLALVGVQAASLLQGISLYSTLETMLDERTSEVARQQGEIGALRVELAGRYQFGEMFGRAPRMQEVYALVERFAPTDYTVLISGESGTGKEVLARTLHGASKRADRPFLAVNCGAIVGEILQSELFGHIRGSFTGATEDKRGFFRDADGGTLFLDEITEMSPDAQVKLLRVLQEDEVLPVGATRPVAVDVRVIAATNQDLDTAVAEGRFRQDLFYRLHVLELPLPPLRERSEDIPGLTARFVEAAASKLERSPPRVSDEALALFERHDWPGNVRELRAALEYATTVCLGEEIAVEHLPPRLRAAVTSSRPIAPPTEHAPPPPSASATLEEVEREHIVRVFEQTGRQRKRTAEILGIGRRTLYRRLHAFGLLEGSEDEEA